MRNKSGEITVFLSLILVVIFSLISTLLEGARIHTAETFIDRALITAMNSLWGEYDIELFNNYHIFAYDSTADAEQKWESSAINNIKECMEYTFMPNKGIMYPGTSIIQKNMDLYNINITDIQIIDSTSIVDYEGDIFFKQAVEYMKYSKSADLLSDIMEKADILKTSGKTSEVIGKKLIMEEKVAEIDENVIKLIECIEGISLDKEGAVLDKKGLLKTNKYFVKKLCPRSISMENLNISSKLIYDSLKSKYINPQEQFKDAGDNIDLYIDSEDENNKYKEELKELENTNTAGMTESQLGILSGKIEDIKKLLNSSEKKKKEAFENIKGNIKVVKENCKKIKGLIAKSEHIISDIKVKQEEAGNEIKNFKEYLNINKKNISDDIYKEIIEETSDMSSYVSSGELEILNLDIISDTLKNNKSVIEKLEDILSFKISENKDELVMLKEELESASQCINAYNIKDLNFNYDGVCINDKVKSPLKIFKEFITQGVMGIVIDNKDDISKAKINSIDLPSHMLRSESKAEIPEYDRILSRNEEKKYNKDITETFSNYGENYCNYEGSKEEYLKALLFDSYIMKHFLNKNKELTANNSHHKLQYEQEYIVCGNDNDYDNLRDIISKIVFIRAVLNFIYLISSREKSSMAKATAVQLVGFLGFVPLISLVKTVILLIWSFEEALIDTRAIISDKAVPFIKNNKNFKLKYNDILIMSKELIKEKAEEYKNKKEGATDFTYEDYIMLFLITEKKKNKIYRTMDIIQENLQCILKTPKLLKNYLYGFELEADFYYSKKFMKLPFVIKYQDTNYSGYQYTTNKEYAY